MSQADIEARWLSKVELVRKGAVQPDQAFATEGDWLLELEGQRFLLHAGLAHWMVYDRIHDEWYDTGYEPGRALMVVQDRQARAVPLPEAPSSDELATIGDWGLVVASGQRLGIWRDAEVRSAFTGGQLPPETRIWSGAVAGWLTMEEYARLAPPAPAARLPLLPVPGQPAPVAAEASPREAERCARCGAALQPNQRFCGACGQRVGPS